MLQVKRTFTIISLLARSEQKETISAQALLQSTSGGVIVMGFIYKQLSTNALYAIVYAKQW